MARLEVIADTFLALSSPVQHAAGALLQAGDRVRTAILARLHLNLRVATDTFAGTAISPLVPEAGWYLILRVPRTIGDEAIALDLLERGVVLHPGYFYDFTDEGYLVVSLLTPESQFRAGLETIVTVVG